MNVEYLQNNSSTLFQSISPFSNWHSHESTSFQIPYQSCSSQNLLSNLDYRKFSTNYHQNKICQQKNNFCITQSQKQILPVYPKKSRQKKKKSKTTKKNTTLYQTKSQDIWFSHQNMRESSTYPIKFNYKKKKYQNYTQSKNRIFFNSIDSLSSTHLTQTEISHDQKSKSENVNNQKDINIQKNLENISISSQPAMNTPPQQPIHFGSFLFPQNLEDVGITFSEYSRLDNKSDTSNERNIMKAAKPQNSKPICGLKILGFDSGKQYIGTVKFIYRKKRFGFINSEFFAESIFFHLEDAINFGVNQGIQAIQMKMKVSFECLDYYGRYSISRKAVNVRLINEDCDFFTY